MPPSGLATRDVTTEDRLESSQGGEKIVVAEDTIPLPVPASVFCLCIVSGSTELTFSLEPRRSSRPDHRGRRLRDARAALTGLKTAAKFVRRGVRLATTGSYYAAKFSINALHYVVAKSLTTFKVGTSHIRPRPRVRPRPIKLRKHIFKPTHAIRHQVQPKSQD